MARKHRRLEQVASAANEPKPARYQDPFQSAVVHRVEAVGQKFEGKGRTILYALGAIILVAIVVAVVSQISRRSSGTAQAALGKAIETSKARVTDVPVPAGSTEKTFKTEKERAEAAIAEFQIVVDKFGGPVGEKAKYFLAVNKLVVDRAAGIQELEGLSTSTSEVGKMAKFALAQTKADDGKLDEAAALYQDLIAGQGNVIATETINFALAKVFEKQGKTAEAVDLYYKIAKASSEEKDADGKPMAMGETGRAAKEKLAQLDPAKASEIKEVDPTTTVNGEPVVK